MKFCKCKKPEPGRTYVGGYEWWDCQKCGKRMKHMKNIMPINLKK